MLNSDSKIIEFVRGEEALYNPKNTNYRNKQFRDSLWERLANELGKPILKLKNKWKNMRDCYRIMRIKNALAQKYDTLPFASYKYSDQMEFLTPFIKEYKPRPRKNSRRCLFTKRKPKPPSSSDFDDFTLETHVIEDSSHSDLALTDKCSNSEDLITFGLVPTEDSSQSSIYNRESHSRRIFIDNTVTNGDLNRIMTREQAAQKDEDEVISFFHYACLATKGLSPENQQNVIFKVFETITEARRIA